MSTRTLLSFLVCLFLSTSAVAQVPTASVTVGPIDTGATLTINGESVSESDVVTVTQGDTVTFVSTLPAITVKTKAASTLRGHYEMLREPASRPYQRSRVERVTVVS